MCNYEGDYNPEYHFGYGLSHTSFEYNNPFISTNNIPKDSKYEIVVSIDIRNTGLRDGKEVVQLYSGDLYASLVPDTKCLRRFEKIHLNPEILFFLSDLPLTTLKQILNCL